MCASTAAAAIVAGGGARRFSGLDKSRLVVDGRTIIVRQVEILQRVAQEIFVVGPDPKRYRDLGLPVYPDILPNLGALGGIYTALVRASADRVIAVACDLPFLNARLLSRLVELSEGHDGAWIKTTRGAEPLLACYHKEAAARIRAELERGRLRAADLDRSLDLAVLGEDELRGFGPPERLLANLNSPDDYARVQYRPS